VIVEDSVEKPPPTESDYESEEYVLPVEKCVVYPAPGWPDCRSGQCNHRKVPETARRKTRRLKKKKGAGPNIKFGDSYKNCQFSNQIHVDSSRKTLHINPEFQQAYNASLARSIRECRGEDPNLVTRKEVGRVTWPMTDVD
jgi:hypothetical protein